MRKYLVFLVLGAAWLISKAFWWRELKWIGGTPPGDPWRGIRVLCFLNHTSLFEWLFIAMAPPRFLWRVACHGVVPAAEKTIRRPIVGQFFKLVGAHVVRYALAADDRFRLDAAAFQRALAAAPRAKLANDDTFHYTNSALQHSRMNQGKELWQGLENYILFSVRDLRMICDRMYVGEEAEEAA